MDLLGQVVGVIFSAATVSKIIDYYMQPKLSKEKAEHLFDSFLVLFQKEVDPFLFQPVTEKNINEIHNMCNSLIIHIESNPKLKFLLPSKFLTNLYCLSTNLHENLVNLIIYKKDLKQTNEIFVYFSKYYYNLIKDTQRGLGIHAEYFPYHGFSLQKSYRKVSWRFLFINLLLISGLIVCLLYIVVFMILAVTTLLPILTSQA
ncbi:MAG: hypothetical protein FWC91_13430 [Defluviitaleaceae bacterium]|nr:hypothetical protein [Defluviitaleaceae bacterium]